MSLSSLAQLLRVRHPILLGGMTWVGRHELAAAVSEAGALGVIGSGGMESEELRDEIRALRAKTQQPFGVNVPLVDVRPTGEDGIVERMIAVIQEEAVPIAATGGGSPARFTARLVEAGCVVLHVVPSARLALKAQAAGVHVVVAESFEAGGHLQSNGLSSFALIPQVVDAVHVPVVAAGGIADARGVAAALALGAAGVQLGTRFIATTECVAHSAGKRALLAAGEDGAPTYCRAHHTSRALATPAVERLIEMERGGASAEELLRFRGRWRTRKAWLEGDLEEGILPAGAAAGLVQAILPAGAVVEELVHGCRALFESLPQRLDPALLERADDAA